MKLKELKPLISGDVIIKTLGIHAKFEGDDAVDFTSIIPQKQTKSIKYSFEGLTKEYLNAEVVDLSGYDDGLTIIIDIRRKSNEI